MGMGGAIGPAVASAVTQANAETNSQNSMAGGANYIPIQQVPAYIPQYQQYQSFQPQQQMANYQSGLQAAMAQMMQQYNRPMMREPVQQGLSPYISPALNYKPDMSGIAANLKRVAPSVAEQQRLQAIEDAKRAEEDAKRAEEEAAQRAAQQAAQPNYDPGGGG